MEPPPNYAAFALPIFGLAIFAEVMVARRRGHLKKSYSIGTALSDIGCGAAFQAFEVLINLGLIGVYAILVEHLALVTWDEGSVWPWLIGAIAVDFLYYWWHRLSHVVNVLWAVHGVHHQSEDYNLAVALRQPILEPVTWFFFYWVLAFVGIPPLVLLTCYGANLFYQFWIHTELVEKLPPWVERVLNTPSHHRVHHGVDEAYLDRNYGGVLLIWDKLFGSFQPEQQRPTYGTTVPLRSYNPLWGNAQHLHRVYRLARAASSWRDRIWAWFAHPAWLPAGVTDPDTKPDRSHYDKYRPASTPQRLSYVIGSMLVLVTLGSPFILLGQRLPLAAIAAAATVLGLSYAVLVGILEHKPWAESAEWVRIAALVGVAAWIAGTTWGAGAAVVAALGLLAVSLPARLMLLPIGRPS